MKYRYITPAIALLALASACQSSDLAAPLSPAGTMATVKLDAPLASPSGNKTMYPIGASNQMTCTNGVVLTQTESGTIQVHNAANGNGPNLELDTFQMIITFTNADGASVVYRDVGVNRLISQDGKLVVKVSGRSGDHIGTFTMDITNGAMLFEAGQDLGSTRMEACAALS